ncbi:GTP-binding protein [Engelhardtia mirabilis]|uniref:Mutual gliding-motility protein MglA n=1 Tax=Engelhardtia mirabilis TaxID=2528011 RepID=A0A518BNR7_9BACT|nr:Mutual gliding-motility protein MglA [Planctomycetes bacterium Pla133]QDV02948.1 Mutual gliding-motility protein MglA [Planctomycetes bacterium Pla86]
MVQINFAQKQINAKVVYYGPGMSGKTTNLEVVHQRAPDNNRGELTSISTDGDRTLFFDYMPLDLGTIAGMKTCFQMYTVPGQVYYNSTRKLVLQGVDGVIFVADSGPDAMEANLESIRNLEENLNEYGKSLKTLPHVIQYNKRDLPGALPVDELDKALNTFGTTTFEGVAATGQGVFPTLKGLAALVLKHIQTECAGGSSRPGATNTTGFHPASQAQASGAGTVSAPPVGGAPTKSNLDLHPAATPAPAPAPTGAVAPQAQSGGTAPAAAAATQPSAARRAATAKAAPTKPAKASPSKLMQTQGNPAPAPSTRPAQRTRTTAPAPQIRRGQGGSGAKTAAFVVAAATVGAVIAHFVLSAL